MPLQQQQLDLTLARRMYSMIAGIDPGASVVPDLNSILSSLNNDAIDVVVPANNVRNPLYVYNRGWWGGGTVDAITGQNQTPIKGGNNLNGSANTDYTVYTPTAGKNGYLTQICVSAATGALFYLEDGTTSTSTSFMAQNSNATPTSFVFPSPFKIATALHFQSNTTQHTYISWCGWEE